MRIEWTAEGKSEASVLALGKAETARREDVIGFFDRLEAELDACGFLRNPEMLYVAIGILGATVMPHNLYLHSSIVQTRKYEDSVNGKREAIRFATIDSSVALMFALFINAAILIVSAAAFHGTEDVGIDELGVVGAMAALTIHVLLAGPHGLAPLLAGRT